MATVERQITFVEDKKEICTDDFCVCRFSSIIDYMCDKYCEECNEHEWAWDDQGLSPATLLSHHNREVRFHPGYSSGTAAVRGDLPLQKGNIYYWEIKMLTSLYGTDVMVGVGTKAAELQKSAYQFCSLLGSDKESWGFSYTGRLQHNGKFEWYGPPFGKGSIIGIYLDMWKGTLEFFLDRRPLGIAFRSMGNNILYPMVCSTAAQSGMRVTLSISHPVSLKLLALQALDGDQETLKQLLQVPGLRRYVSNYWWLLGRRDEDCGLAEIADQGSREHRTCKHQEDDGKCARRLCVMCDIIL
ncbi:SPRY domain-containing SOCS box protein 3 [Cimex lectularius]|uniref:B30.2/SPRY domain-containing protein n=1 Tax=Cimex lectularius TaxID=79782 RepID=A0A8I6TF45_CIMLE|nr:SPRY domain-containing SOCS box protein 3 [Cimex lectularius]